jgi:hypothetical protein
MLTYPTPADLGTNTFGAFAIKCFVVVDGIKVRPVLRDLKVAYDHNLFPLVVSEESIVRGRENAAVAALKSARFRAFCAEDGINPDTCERVEEDGRVGLYQPDAMGFPTLVMYKDEL